MIHMRKLAIVSISCIFIGAYIVDGIHALGIVMIIVGFLSLIFGTMLIDLNNEKL